ncbi:MAG: protein kinase domain-containing protein [Planctomycetota bacterium]|jgi:tRNA A-37 threonylcarbamoyl transferase component Bud32/outer membrane protein assembly factor BamD (BamD/ComL family)
MSEEIPFGRIAVSRGLITQSQLEEALLAQARGRAEGASRRLGVILVEMGHMAAAGVRAVLKEQGKTLHSCTDCSTSYTLHGELVEEASCPRCDSKLLPAAPDDLGADGPLVAEAEGTLYVIEDDPTSLPAVQSQPAREGSSLGEAHTISPAGATTSGTLGGAMALEGLPPPRMGRPRSPDLEIGDVVGGCEVIRLLGRGGMGTVYEAMHIALNKRVALKILSPHMTDHPVLIQRFLQEARTAAKLDHANIVQVLNVGQDGTHRFIVMQYVEGQSLGQLLDRKGKLDVRRSLEIGGQVARGLEAAHAMGIIHRDVKPGNVMIQPDGTAKIADFGLAKELDAEKTLSKAGQVLGSPHYLSPEQAEGLEVDLRTDIYSLGITMFHTLSGKRPFSARSPVGVIVKHLKEPPPDIRKVAPHIPPVVATLILKMMAKDPGERYRDCGEVRSALETILHPASTVPSTIETTPSLWKPIALAAIILLLLVGAGVTAGLVTSWFGLFGTPASPNDEGEDRGEEEYKKAMALLEIDPPRTDLALEELRKLVRTFGQGSKWGILAARKIDHVLKDRDGSAIERLNRARTESRAAIDSTRFGDALAAVEGLSEALSQTVAEEGAVHLERTVRRDVLIGRLTEEARKLEKEHRFDEILARFSELEQTLPVEDRPFVSDAAGLWLKRKGRWEKEADDTLATLMREFGNSPHDLPAAVTALMDFEEGWTGAPAAKAAKKKRQSFEERILSSGNAKEDYYAADAFAAANPQDYDMSIKRFRALESRYPDNSWGDEAAERAKELIGLREEKAVKAFAVLSTRTRGLVPEKALKVLETFPDGIRGSRIYKEKVKLLVDRLTREAETRQQGSRKALDRASALHEASAKPRTSGVFRKVIAAFQTVVDDFPETPDSKVAASTIERLRTDRRLEANKAFESAMARAGSLADDSDWEGARKALDEGFLRIYDDSLLSDKALRELERLSGAQIADRFRGREEEALAQIESFAKKHPEDFRGILSRYEELRPRVTESDLRERLDALVRTVSVKFEKKAVAALVEVRKKAAEKETGGDHLGTIRMFRSFPETFRGTTAFDEAMAEARRREALAEEMIRGADDVLRRNPEAFRQALAELEAVIERYPKTKWSRQARNKRSEILARAEWAAGRRVREAEGLLGRGKLEKAREIFDEVAHWDVEKISVEAASKARLCEVRLGKKSMFEKIRTGAFLEALALGERFLQDPDYSDVREEVEPLIKHSRNLSEGFVFVPGGAFRLDGKPVILKPYYILATEVTNTDYRNFIASGGYDRNAFWEIEDPARADFVDRTGRPGPRHWRGGDYRKGLGNHPVRYVTWHEARAFARWKGGDLPTEDQWIVAAGWDSTKAKLRSWPWGESYTEELCWAGKSHEFAATSEVGRFEKGKSPFGCHDMAGNVAEWVLAWSDETSKKYRLLKGGDSSDFAVSERTRVLSRERAAPGSANPGAGFRIVRPGKVIHGLD